MKKYVLNQDLHKWLQRIYYKKYSPSVQICRSTGLHWTADLGLHVTLWVVIGFKTWLQLLQ
jgi:hypothetical protein